ncbi:ead/Ea22-like family protein [Escherichia coli]|uniref:ead/Ea22-like family protein n=1 Tax=Escherichia coli TaxID=562 RepID=UPI000D0B019C|nr:ead/Ea22-like family protein [Escherichia coli]MCI3335979.1 ead/Ea22-like family protein [Escherichia coli]MCK2413488.1 ead/Ea22-like family protein [Escherichia coli]MCK2433787.1 ead/Ea22-like family protein [Escherichia coli]
MSNINYQALRMAAENATPGEWCSDDYYGVIADAGLNANYYIASCSGPAYFHERRSLNNFHRDRVITFEQIAE